jgi:hypothetical protein
MQTSCFQLASQAFLKLFKNAHNFLCLSFLEEIKGACTAAQTPRTNKMWCRGTGLNRRHGDFQSPALPTELPRLDEESSKQSSAFMQVFFSLFSIFFVILYASIYYY